MTKRIIGSDLAIIEDNAMVKVNIFIRSLLQ